MEIKFGSRILTPGVAVDQLRISLIIWGPAGAGKTSLASSAPGNKLWISFDPDGLLSLPGRQDVYPLDLSDAPHAIIEQMKAEDPLQLSKIISDPQIHTVIIDSITMASMLATENAVARQASSRNKISLESPGQSGFTHRNALVLRTFVVLQRMTKKYNKHFIVITHEGTTETDDDGRAIEVQPALSRSLANQIGLQTNEVWYLYENEATKRREILFRPGKTPPRKWVKTRMWKTDKGIIFPVEYDATTNIGEGLHDWFDRWKSNDGKHIPIPTK